MAVLRGEEMWLISENKYFIILRLEDGGLINYLATHNNHYVVMPR